MTGGIHFRYAARTAGGVPVRGSMRAASAEAVLHALRGRALFVTAIEREAGVGARIARSFGYGGVARRARLAFFRSLATLIAAGVPIRRALDVCAERCGDSALREALRSAAAAVESGTPLSGAMACQPAAFPALAVAMISAGERGGILDEVLARMAAFAEREATLRSMLRSALAYPAVVLIAASGLVAFLLAHVVPMFAAMFESFHTDLPPTTALLLRTGELLHSGSVWAAFAAAALGVALALVRIRTTARGALTLDALRLRLPVIGPLIRTSVCARLARTLATLLRCGVDLVAAVDAVLPVAGSAVYRRALAQVSVAIRAGEPLSAPLAAARAFDPLFVALVRVGEETGALDEMLLKLAQYFEGDVESSIATLGAVLEPALIVGLGAVVGFIVFSVFIPLYSLIGSVAK